jgi:SAM-dependent methyltransferase
VDVDERHSRRTTFDGVVDLYDDYRQVAPAKAFDDLVLLTATGPGSHVLEIGCGTGKATRPLAERGLAITAVELGTGLAERARRNLASYPGVRIATSSFEQWEPDGTPFDAVVSFNAFHWIDEDVRFAKSAAVLREGGHLAVFGSRLVEHSDCDPIWLALQEDFVAATGEPESRVHLRALRDRSAEFAEGGHFRRATRMLYRRDITYDADGFVSLLRTMSSYSTLDDDVREDLFERIRRRIDASGGTISPTEVGVLYVAQRT